MILSLVSRNGILNIPRVLLTRSFYFPAKMLNFQFHVISRVLNSVVINGDTVVV